jgi:hypothetical protein
MSLFGGKQTRDGWVEAPPTVAAEIRTVWQEDELPEELTSSSGYVPFTLGVEAQAWVDSMENVVDGGTAVYGRPRAIAPPVRRSLATPSAPATPPRSAAPVPRDSSTRDSRRAVAPLRPIPPRRAPAPMPGIGGGEPQKSRSATPPGMPDIGSGEPQSAHPGSRAGMPEIGSAERNKPRSVTPMGMPDIGSGDPATSGSTASSAMPDIGGARPRTLPRRVVMPDIGQAHSEAHDLPEIGEARRDAQPQPEIGGARRRPPTMPDIGE